MKKKNNRKYNNKGITLIALIITIIVMLILVGVAVTVSLKGELFNTSRKAASETQLEKDREVLLGQVVSSMNRKAEVEFDKLDSMLPTGFQKIYSSSEEGIYKSESNNYFRVDKKRWYI